MVDVSKKTSTAREAIAMGTVHMKKQTLSLITNKKISKGDVFETARLAGIMAAKRTSELIPLCHPLNISSVTVDLSVDSRKNSVNIEAKVKCAGQTGVEMEAMTAVLVSALTVYDMCKAVDRGIVISDIKLMRKSGGKSGNWVRTTRRSSGKNPR